MIQFQNVVKTYPNGVQALKGVSLEVEQGDFVAIIGLSGAGKSTLLRSINQMHTITDGKLLVNGVDVSSLKGKALRRFRRDIGMVFQSFNLVKRTTVIKNVLAARVADMPLWMSLLGLYTKKNKIIALEALDQVGILEKAYTRADQLSGGQQQRVALARCLAQQPKIILADEPTGALDSKSGKDVVQILKDLNAQGHTIIMVTHNPDLMAYATRVITMFDGKIDTDTKNRRQIESENTIDKIEEVTEKLTEIKEELGV